MLICAFVSHRQTVECSRNYSRSSSGGGGCQQGARSRVAEYRYGVCVCLSCCLRRCHRCKNNGKKVENSGQISTCMDDAQGRGSFSCAACFLGVNGCLYMRANCLICCNIFRSPLLYRFSLRQGGTCHCRRRRRRCRHHSGTVRR